MLFSLPLFLKPMVLLSILSAAAVTDAVFHKVANSLILTGFILEGALHLTSGVSPEPAALGYSAAFILLMAGMFSLGMAGGADVKLYLLVAFTYPDSTGLRTIVLSVVLGALYSLFILFGRGMAAERFSVMKAFVSARLAGVKEPYHDGLRGNSQAVIPMAVFIFAGALLSVL